MRRAHGVGEHAQRRAPPRGLGLPDLRLPGRAGTPRARAAPPARDTRRITSYNVCYTKLLRPSRQHLEEGVGVGDGGGLRRGHQDDLLGGKAERDDLRGDAGRVVDEQSYNFV